MEILFASQHFSHNHKSYPQIKNIPSKPLPNSRAYLILENLQVDQCCTMKPIQGFFVFAFFFFPSVKIYNATAYLLQCKGPTGTCLPKALLLLPFHTSPTQTTVLPLLTPETSQRNVFCLPFITNNESLAGVTRYCPNNPLSFIILL